MQRRRATPRSDPLPSRLPLQKRPTRLADDIARVLHDMILDGELRPGTPLLQIQLARRLGVSRTPLREAFHELEHDGLLRVSNGNKTVQVAGLEPCHLVETYQVREAVDGLAARLTADRAPAAEDLAVLAGSLRAMEAASCGASLAVGEYAAAHNTFHLGILALSGNSRLGESAGLVRFSSKMLVVRYLRQHHPGPEALIRRAVEVGNRDHRSIFEAIARGDVEAAGENAATHIRRTTLFAQGLAADPG